MQPHVVEVSRVEDFDAAFAAIRSAKTQAILVVPEPLIQGNRGLIADFAQAQGCRWRSWGAPPPPASGLLAYGPNAPQYPQLTARNVDRILKGAKPGQLAVEQPSRFDLVIDLRRPRRWDLSFRRRCSNAPTR